MALTARGGVLALLGALVVGLVWPSGLAVLVITGLIVGGIGVDIVLAPSVRGWFCAATGHRRAARRACHGVLARRESGVAAGAGTAPGRLAAVGRGARRPAQPVPAGERRRVTTFLVPLSEIVRPRE